MENDKSKYCRDIEDLLVDYVDNELSPDESSKVTEHLEKCSACQNRVNALQESLELTQSIWQDGLLEIDDIQVGDLPATIVKHSARRLIVPFAVAASLLLAAGLLFTFHAQRSPTEEVSPAAYLATVEREIQHAQIAAKLLATAELLSDSPGTKTSAQEQYRHILQMYPDTSAAKIANSLTK